MLNTKYPDCLRNIQIGDEIVWINSFGNLCRSVVEGWGTVGNEPMLLTAGRWNKDPNLNTVKRVSLSSVIECRRHGKIIRFSEHSVDTSKTA